MTEFVGDKSPVEEKDIAMRTPAASRNTAYRTNSEFAGADPAISESRSASIHLLLNSSVRSDEHWGPVRSTRMPKELGNETAERLIDIDGLPILVRFVVKDIPLEMQMDFIARGANIHSLLSTTLETMVDRMRGSSLRGDASLKPPLAIIELISSGEPSLRLPAPPDETVLRVGPLELDLLDRSAKRGDRQIGLRPREFQLLKYMMQRTDKSLTRTALLKEVWNYRFVPETNLVDVHMGRLRRKIDGPNEAPMIRNVRGVGFVLSAAPLTQDSHRSNSVS
jgi:DNA-binding winged helix-turn-helix (wHTH) protein